MNLFSVKNANDKIIIRYNKEGVGVPAFFTNKQEAKTFRNLCNSEQPHCDYPCYISKGPDHRNYKAA